jgi:hypothetical protein
VKLTLWLLLLPIRDTAVPVCRKIKAMEERVVASRKSWKKNANCPNSKKKKEWNSCTPLETLERIMLNIPMEGQGAGGAHWDPFVKIEENRSKVNARSHSLHDSKQPRKDHHNGIPPLS